MCFHNDNSVWFREGQPDYGWPLQSSDSCGKALRHIVSMTQIYQRRLSQPGHWQLFGARRSQTSAAVAGTGRRCAGVFEGFVACTRDLLDLARLVQNAGRQQNLDADKRAALVVMGTHFPRKENVVLFINSTIDETEY